MSDDAIATVRRCLAAVKPDADLGNVADDTALLQERIITSFDIIDLILRLEEATGTRISRDQLAPGSFRDIRTIASVFVREGAAG